MPSNLFTEEEVNQLNCILDNQLDRSVEDLMNIINANESQQFNNVDLNDYLKVFDQVTTAPSKDPTEQEFQHIQEYWMNLPDEQFQTEEQNLLEWAAITL